MKHFLSLVLILFSQLVFAQTLPTASPAFDWSGAAIWFLVAAVIVGIFFFVRNHPDSVAKVKAELSSLTATHTAVVAALAPAAAPVVAQPSVVPQLVQLAQDQHATIQQQQAVISSPAVQAAVNAVQLPPGASLVAGDGLIWTATPGPWGPGYFEPNPETAAISAAKQAASAATVADMTPDHWSQAHIIGAILNSGAIQGQPYVNAFTALCAATGETATTGTPPGAAKALSDTQGSKFASALANMRSGGMPIDAAYKNQSKGVDGNASDPDFSEAELSSAWALAQSYGVK